MYLRSVLRGRSNTDLHLVVCVGHPAFLLARCCRSASLYFGQLAHLLSLNRLHFKYLVGRSVAKNRKTVAVDMILIRVEAKVALEYRLLFLFSLKLLS